MEYMISMHTDVGIRKETNQDSCCIKEAVTDKGRVLFALMCDGMGGLAKGEVASATLIRAFSEWFEKELPLHLAQPDPIGEVRYRWDRLMKEQNQTIGAYGRKYHIQLGSTVTAFLVLEDGEYIVGHVGDSRLYRITDHDLMQLTDDQTVVAKEIKMGRLTPEQAEVDPRRNVLLQCVGASRIVEPAYYREKITPDTCYLLCSDGFRHKVTPEEIQFVLRPGNNPDERTMKNNLTDLVEMNKARQESDNITVVLVKTVREGR